MRRNYSTSVILHVLFLLLLFLCPIMQEQEPREVQHAIIVDFSRMEDSVKPAAKSKKSAATNNTKPTPKVVKESSAAPKPTSPKPVKAELKEQKTDEREQKVIAAKVVNKPQEEKPVGPTPAEIEAAKKQKEKAAKKSKFSDMLSKSKKKTADAGDDTDTDDGDLKGESDEGASGSNGHSNIRGVLGNRKVLKVPTIKDDSQKKGRVVVKICVNANGDVTSSTYTMMGSTTSDTYLIKLAEKGAMDYKFSKSKNAKECGKVVIDFLLK